MLSVRFTLGLVLLFMMTGVVAPVHAQISVEATPYSFRANLVADVPSYTLYGESDQKPTPQLRREAETAFLITPPAQPGLEIPVDLGFDNAGRWTQLPDGGRLWQLRLSSEGANSLHLVYDDFWMPKGATLFLYNDDRSVVLGAFTERNNKSYGQFSTDFVAGEATTVEYYEPAGAEPGRLHIALAKQGWSRPGVASKGGETSGYTPTSLSCSINTACSEGNGWSDAIKSVVKISNGCTGVLVNNEEENELPYVLTANHCGSPTVGQVVNWVFSFNYQSDTCADPADTPVAPSISGATVRAANNGAADFTLLELSAPIPAEYNVYFAGWSIETDAAWNGTVLGHPSQDIKKITIDDDPIVDMNLAYWRAQLDHGTIEGGSSGSPLFNGSQELVGLVSSALGMDPNACSGPGGDDNAPNIMFPKLSYMWGFGLQQYLDPQGTGTMTLPYLEGTGSLLPVELVLFEARLDGSAAELRWKTASETNNAGFDIQHIDPTLNQWQSLGFVDGHGTTIEAQTYAYRVDNLTAGTHRFRLKQIDFDGAFEYSPEVEVAVGLPTAYHLSPAYPNPFNPQTQFSVSVARTQRVEVSVYDVVGRRVALLHDGVLGAQTTQAMRFEAGSLPSGLYVVRVLGEHFVTSQTITLVK